MSCTSRTVGKTRPFLRHLTCRAYSPGVRIISSVMVSNSSPWKPSVRKGSTEGAGLPASTVTRSTVARTWAVACTSFTLPLPSSSWMTTVCSPAGEKS